MINASAVLERVEKLGKKYPDELRPCQYVDKDGQGCCIVGRALIEEGADPGPFLEDEDLNKFTSVAELFRDYAEELGLRNDLSENDFIGLKIAQSRQDADLSWGSATEHLR